MVDVLRPQSATIIYRVGRALHMFTMDDPDWSSLVITDLREFRTVKGRDAYEKKLAESRPGTVVSQVGVVHWFGDNDAASAECNRLQKEGVPWE